MPAKFYKADQSHTDTTKNITILHHQTIIRQDSMVATAETKQNANTVVNDEHSEELKIDI